MAITRHPSREDEKNPERPVRLDKTEGHIVIEGRAYPAREIVEALAQSGYAELRASGDSIVLGRRRITPIFKSRQDRAMASLCHASLSFCCPMSKRCAERDRALEMLGLTPDEYERLKGDAHIRFIESARGFTDRGTPSEYDGHESGLANQPAVDRGYGSDDYRRDYDSLERTLQPRSYPEQEPSPWGRHEPSATPIESASSFDGAKRTDSYSDLSNLFGDDGGSTGSTCSIRSGDKVEGVGSLFAQGELSPFSDDSQGREDRTFCFSCGRTFRAGTKVCPWCGVPQ
ncbi:MAG: hypothetical protein ACXABY_24980 [Candidatus Thorarchaeota archaeon]